MGSIEFSSAAANGYPSLGEAFFKSKFILYCMESSRIILACDNEWTEGTQ